jgi:Chaperone of endosialidase
MKTITKSIYATFGAFALACFSPFAHAAGLNPPPDGGYPGGNTAQGANALFSLTTGGYNTGVGWFSLRNNMSGSYNTGLGAATLFANTGNQNTATGAAALFSNTTGFRNTADGAFALLHNLGAADNTATGNAALFANTTGSGNTATGNFALIANDTGSDNTAMGNGALGANTIGGFNTALGSGALSNSLGLGNIGLGALAGGNIMGASNVIAIGHAGADVSNTTWINNIYGIATISGVTVPVIVSDAGQLGTNSSSRRFKKDIKAMEKTSESILALKPVTFHYKTDSKRTPQFGLVAEEVAQVNPGLVVRDKNGEIYTVRYDAVNVMLLNEFLKEHKEVQQQTVTIAELKKEIVSLATTVKEQAAQIQKVSAKIETSEVAMQVAVNKP